MHFASMSLGILDFLIEWLTQFLIWLIGWVMDLIMLLISDLLYMAATYLLDIVDICQLIFKKLCGMDVYWVTQTGDASGFGSGWQVANAQRMEGIDPLMSMFTNESVTEVLIALSLVSVVMVIVAAIIKVIQTEFSTEGSKNSKGAIFGQALKSLMLFFLVPICCIGGIGISNALLKAIDRATSLAGDGSTMGSQILVSAISSQNVVREGQAGDLSESDWAKVGVNGKPTITDSNREQYANIIDIAFRSNSVMSPDSLYGYQSLALIKTFYDVPGINFIVLIGGALLAAYTLLMASFGMVMRLFKATILYVVSPPMVALMPLDGGSAFKSWRKNFVGQLLSAYGTVVGLNLLFIILPVVNNINLFGTEDFVWTDNRTGNAFWHGQIAAQYNAFCQMLFTLTGLFMLKDLSKMIGDMIGADDAAGAGAGMAGKVVGTAAKIGTVAGGAVGGIVGKGVGAMMASKSKRLAASGDVKGAEKAARASALWGNTGNKLAQKAKGTMGAALNKGVSMATGGGIKSHFSEEMDYDKAVAAKKEKDDARDKRIAAGEGSMFDYANKGLDVAGKEVGRFGARVGGGVIGAAGKLFTGHAKDMGSAFASGWTTGADIVDGGAATRAKALALPVQQAAGVATAEGVHKTYQDLSSVTGGTAISDIIGRLAAGDKEGANEGIGAILQALNSIAEKTEEQKDLIQKLQNLQSRVDATNNKTEVKNLGTTLQAAGNKTTEGLTTATSNVNAHAQAVFNIVDNGSGTAAVDLSSVTDIEGKLKSMTEQLAEKISGDTTHSTAEFKKALAEAKQQILGTYKKELEKFKEETDDKK